MASPAVRRSRYGHRDLAGEAGRHLRAVHSGRWLDDPSVRRNRTGSRHLRSARRAHGRSDHGAERASVTAARSSSMRASASQSRHRLRSSPSSRSVVSGFSWSTTTPPIGEFSRTRSDSGPSIPPWWRAAPRGSVLSGRLRSRASRSPWSCSTRTCPKWTASGSPNVSEGSAEWEQVTVLMLSSAGHRDDAARCRSWACRAYLTKPIKRSELLETMLAVVCPPGVDDALAHPLVTRHTLRERVPLCEFFSPRTTRSTSDSRRGCSRRRGLRIKIAGNGREAVTAWSQARPRRVRPRADGRPDARAWTASRRPARSGRGRRERRPRADHRDDRACHGGRPRTMPRRRHGRLFGQTSGHAGSVEHPCAGYDRKETENHGGPW